MTQTNQLSTVSAITTFGDARRMLLDVIQDLRSGDMPVDRGMAIAATMKVINDNINSEINAAKMCAMTEGGAHEFGKIVGMGKRLIGTN